MTVCAKVRKPTLKHLAIDLVDSSGRRQDKVKREEMALQTIRYVLASTPRVTHSTKILQILDVFDVASFVLVQKAEALSLDELAHQL